MSTPTTEGANSPTKRPDEPTPQQPETPFKGAFPVLAGHCKPDEIVVLKQQFDAVADKCARLERELHEARVDAARSHCEMQKAKAELAAARADSERLDWLDGQLKNMDATKGGTWLRIGDNGRVQLHRYPLPHHAQHLVWHDEHCELDSIPDHPVSARAALDAARQEGSK